MTASSEDRRHAAEDRVKPVPAVLLDHAAELLFRAYVSDPEFGDLYGLSPGRELDSTRQIFQSVVRYMSPEYGTTLGCRRAGRLVGVCTYYPEAHVPLRRWWPKHPFTMTAAMLRHAWLQLRWRPSFGPTARARWRTYCRLARSQLPKECHLHVLALGVEESAWRSGVAGRLLAAIDTDTRWRPHYQAIVVDTWHASKVEVYQHLGFTTAAYATSDGVQCWTLVRPLSPLHQPPQ